MELGPNWRCEESAKSARSFLRRHFATCWHPANDTRRTVYVVSAVRTSLSASEPFGHSQAWPGLWLLASSGFFVVSRTAKRSRSRASLGGDLLLSALATT